MLKANHIKQIICLGNTLKAICDTGTLRVIPYGENVVHVAFYPGQETALPLWGIDAAPDSDVAVQWEETKDGCFLGLPKLGIEINSKNATIAFCGKEKEIFTTWKEYGLERTQILGEETYHVTCSFTAKQKERFYGLGQHQDGRLNLGGREQILWHDYSHKGGEIVAVPFLVTNMGYGILFDNASRTKVTCGVLGHTKWEAEAGQAVSFFFIGAEKTDELYEGYRLLCGETPLPPRSGLGLIQCKQRYASEQELLLVAKKYHEKKYPCDIFVVDWFHWKVLGDLSLDKEFWPDAEAMNKELEAMGYEVMISCWPRFMKESAYYDELESKGWFMKSADGETVYGTQEDRRGALIDTTNPACGQWYFDKIKENYGSKGFRYWWTDENEPDISPRESFLYAGTGAAVHNLYPLTHSKCIYEGHRKTYSHRCLTLSRAAFTGAQKYGTTFWSSDIFPEWDVLKRQIPTALNFCASGMPYWSSDIGGWQALPDEESSEDYSSLLIGTKSDGMGAVTKKNYTELYIRWYQFGVFCPTFRTHGTRKQNELWSYGEEAEKILATYLRLRYKLLPYIYSLAYEVTRTGAPFMRALWMDFPEEAAAETEDEYMFGPAFLVAPVTEQGAVSREVYLPAGELWTDFWSGKQYEGGQRITADAPIEILPLYVKGGSIIPMGGEVENSKQKTEVELKIYPGKDAAFLLYEDDGCTYAYENGACKKTLYSWSEKDQKLSVDNQ